LNDALNRRWLGWGLKRTATAPGECKVRSCGCTIRTSSTLDRGLGEKLVCYDCNDDTSKLRVARLQATQHAGAGSQPDQPRRPRAGDVARTLSQKKAPERNVHYLPSGWTSICSTRPSVRRPATRRPAPYLAAGRGYIGSLSNYRHRVGMDRGPCSVICRK